MVTQKSQFCLCVLPARYPLALLQWVLFHLCKHLKRLSPQLWSSPIWSQTLKLQSRLTPLTTLCHCPFDHNSKWWVASDCIPLPDFFLLWNSTTMSMKRAPGKFWSFQTMWHYLKGSGLLIMWSPITGTCNTFQQPKSSCVDKHNGPNTFPDSSSSSVHPEPQHQPYALTRQWDIYPKEGIVTIQCQPTELLPCIHFWATGIIALSYYPVCTYHGSTVGVDPLPTWWHKSGDVWKYIRTVLLIAVSPPSCTIDDGQCFDLYRNDSINEWLNSLVLAWCRRLESSWNDQMISRCQLLCGWRTSRTNELGDRTEWLVMWTK